MKKSLLKVWYGKDLTEKDYNNLGDLMIVAIVLILLNYLIIF